MVDLASSHASQPRCTAPPNPTPPHPIPFFVITQGHPIALQRLAAFFQEQGFHASSQRKPVVVVGPADTRSRCLVVGYQATGRVRGSRLGEAFAAAAGTVGARAATDAFDAAVIELDLSDVERFKAELLRLSARLL